MIPANYEIVVQWGVEVVVAKSRPSCPIFQIQNQRNGLVKLVSVAGLRHKTVCKGSREECLSVLSEKLNNNNTFGWP